VRDDQETEPRAHAEQYEAVFCIRTVGVIVKEREVIREDGHGLVKRDPMLAFV